MTFVYALLDVDRKIRYVGHTKNLELRRYQHWQGRHRLSDGQRQLREWLCSLSQWPEIHVLEEVDHKDRYAAETYWINVLHQVPGVDLLNRLGTGEPQPDSVKRKISEAKIGKPGPKQTPEMIAKRVEKLRGRKHSDEWTAKLRDQKRTDEQCHNIREATLPSRDIDVMCDECSAGPFRGNAGMATHKSKIHGYVSSRKRYHRSDQ